MGRFKKAYFFGQVTLFICNNNTGKKNLGVKKEREGVPKELMSIYVLLLNGPQKRH